MNVPINAVAIDVSSYTYIAIHLQTNKPGLNASATVKKGLAHMMTFRDTACLLAMVVSNIFADASSADSPL